MEATLSIKEYMAWTWYRRTRYIDIRKDYKKLSDIPEKFLPKSVFVNGNEFDEAIKARGSVCSGKCVDNSPNFKDIDIEWLDDFDYQAKLESSMEEDDDIVKFTIRILMMMLVIAGFFSWLLNLCFGFWIKYNKSNVFEKSD